MIYHFIEALYLTAALIAVGACVPQLRQLVRAKASDEFNLSTWLIWTLTQSVTLTYVISIGNFLMAAVNLVWVGFYATMAFLIVRYRYRATRLMTVEELEA